MLVLTRQRDERIMIGDNIVITVVDIRGDNVRLGINAPREIPVHRAEVYQNIMEEKAIEKFRECLQSNDYLGAYETILELEKIKYYGLNQNKSKPTYYKPSSEELVRLRDGLEGLGKLTKPIKSKLEQFLK